MRSHSRWIAIGLGLGLALAGNAGCACVHKYRESVIQVFTVRDADTGTRIPNFVVRNVRCNGVERDLWAISDEPAYRVQLQGDSLVCRSPCGFGTEEGHYVITISAPGYPPQERAFDATYDVFNGGCPSYNDEGTHVAFVLDRDG